MTAPQLHSRRSRTLLGLAVLFCLVVVQPSIRGAGGQQPPPSLPQQTCPAVTFGPDSSLPNGVVGTAYGSQALTASGGAGSYSFAVRSGVLPDGISLSAAGALSGLPTTAGGYSFTVQVTDANGCTGSQDLALTVSTQSNSETNVMDAAIERTIRVSPVAGADSVPAGTLLSGRRDWIIDILNQDPTTTFHHPAIHIVSGLNGATGTLSPQGTSINFPFDISPTAATLAPSSAAAGADGLRQDIVNTTVTGFTTPGFDSSRSVSPLIISAGGGTQTVTVHMKLVDPRYLGVAQNLGMRVFGDCRSVIAPGNLDQGEQASSSCMAGDSGIGSISNARLDKDYVFTVVLNVPNAGSGSVVSKPAVSVQSTINRVPGGVLGSSVSIADNLLGGDAVFSVDEKGAEWHPRIDDSFIVDYTSMSAPNTIATTTNVSLSPGSNQTFGQQQSVDLSVTPAGSVPAPTGHFGVMVDGAAPVQVPVSASGITSFGLGSLSVGTHTVNASYSGDSNYSSSSGSLTFAVNPPNNPPSFSPPSPPNGSTINATAGTPVTFTVSANDPDFGDTVTLALNGSISLPAGAAFPSASGNAAQSTFTWTPGSNQVGSYPLTFVAVDTHGAWISLSVTISVIAPPTFSAAPTPAPPAGTCLCTPVIGIENHDVPTQNWYVQADASGTVSVSFFTRTLNDGAGGSMTVTLFDSSNNVVDQALHVPLSLVAQVETFAGLTAANAAAGAIYRLQITLDPGSMGQHYRFELRGAVQAGLAAPIDNFEPDRPVRWGVNVAAQEALIFTLLLPGGDGVSQPPTQARIRLIDPNGQVRLDDGATFATLPRTITIADAGSTPGQWGIQIVDLTTSAGQNSAPHYKIDKTSGTDHGVYLVPLSYGTGNVVVALTRAGGSANLQPINLQFTNTATGDGRFFGNVSDGFFPSLPVGPYTVTASTQQGQVNPATSSVNVYCHGTSSLAFDVPNLPPPTLTASPLSVVGSGTNITISGTGVPFANVLLFDGGNQSGGNIPADSNGNWSTSRGFIVGSHALTATQSSGSQTSGSSTPTVTVHVRPPTPNISGPNSVTSATSPATFTLTGGGMYGAAQAPPVGSTVTIFEGSMTIGTATVTVNGQWSTSVTLAYGSHSLTASQTLAEETSDMSSPPFVVTVSAPLGPPTLTASPTTTTAPGASVTIIGTGVSGASISLFDGGNPSGPNPTVDANGNWQASLNLLVGTHTLTAKQSSGGQTSGLSSAVTVHVLPPAPNFSGPSSVISATSPATVTLTGGGFYSSGLSTGATVTIFEGSTTLGTALVGPNGQWSTPVQLAYGQHSLTASQTLAGETSAVSSPPFVFTVSAPLAPPTLTASPLTVVSGTNITISGTGVPFANVLLFDGGNPSGGNIPADSNGNWSTSRNFIVGSHVLTATQSSGNQTSDRSSATTVHVQPQAPSFNGPSSVISATSPATVTLTGGGFYGNGQTPPTGATVTIFENATTIGTAIVGSNGQWSTPVQLAYGQHSLTAWQTLAEETSAVSSPPFVFTVSAPLAPPTLTASPLTVVSGTNITISGTGVPGASVTLFDGAGPWGQNTTVDPSGNWSTSGNFIVGSHVLTATQSSGNQTSGRSSATTVHVQPQAPGFNGPSSVISATSPATVTLTGFGFYGNGQTPPTGATVTIFEGSTTLGTAVVGWNGQWSTSVQLAYGPHSLTASQTLAGETSAVSSPPFVVTVSAPPPPMLRLLGNSPMTIEAGSTFVDPGATASGTLAGDLTAQIHVTGTVNANVPGTYTLTYSVSDGSNTTTTTRTVNVVDTIAPTIDAHANVTAQATSASGAAVTYTPPATHDLVDGTGTANCLPVSGSTFALGTTTVTCTATDHAGNTATSTSFTVQATASTTTSISAPTVTYNTNGSVTVTVASMAGSPSGSVSLSVDGGTPLTRPLVAGSATFVIPNPNAGDHTLSATFASQGNFGASSATGALHVNVAATTTMLTSSPNPSNAGQSVTFTATVNTAGGAPIGAVTFKDGTTALATVPVNGSGQAVFATSTLALGVHSITAVYNGSANFTGSTSASLVQIVFAYPTGSGGGFVIGDLNAVVGTHVTFWGSQWEKLNALSGGSASSSFKGFADSTSTNPPIAGGRWSTNPGNSSGPPSTIPTYMAVIVSSTITKSGSTISGNIPTLVIVKTDSGYSSNPGHAGTGTIVAVIR